MTTTPLPSTQTATQVLDTYFLETRCKLIEIAATLDRIDRGVGNSSPVPIDDPRLQFIQSSLTILSTSAPNRAEQIQLLYSKS